MFCLNSLSVAVLIVLLGSVSCKNDGNSRRSDDATIESLESMVREQASVIQNLQARLTAAENKISTVENGYNAQANEIAALKAARSKVVAFTARFTHDPVAISQHSTLVFDKVVYNAGNGYDPHTGIFTAPHSGVYAIFLSEMANSGAPTDLDLAIIKNGVIIDIVYGEGPTDANDQGSSQVTTHLNKGDRVWIRQNLGSSVRGSWYTIFTGYFLHAD